MCGVVMKIIIDDFSREYIITAKVRDERAAYTHFKIVLDGAEGVKVTEETYNKLKIGDKVKYGHTRYLEIE